MSVRRGIVASLCLALDALAIMLVAGILLAIALGGVVFELAEVRVRLTSLTNPTLFASLALVARYFLAPEVPFLRIPAFRLHALRAWSLRCGGHVVSDRPNGVPAWKVIGALSIAAITVKLAAAWFLPGFFSGDDVEIHEMTLSVLYGLDLPVWSLRSPFFPIAFIYPAQWLANAVGLNEPAHLVFAGRAVVAMLSTAAIALTWVAARRLTPEYPAVAVISVAFVTFNKLQMSFGSSELPRPVSTVLVLGAFILLLSMERWQSVCAGGLLGLATAFRFSEMVFVLPAALVLASQRRWRQLSLACVGFLAAMLTVVGIADYLYWGTPFSSLWNAVDYTLIDRASSRGYEPVFAYLVLVPQWTNSMVFLLAIVGCWHQRILASWVVIPIAVLSVLPHKETRYLIPIVPFVCLAAAFGLFAVARFVLRERSTRPARAIAILLPPLLALGIMQDVGGWRLRRSNEEVRLAEWLRSQGHGGVAIRHVWKAGGGAYLSGNRPLVEIDDPRFGTADGRREMFKDVRWLVVDPPTAQLLDEVEIQALGFHFVRFWGDRLRVYSKN